jgi:hypothetical protein
VAEIPDVAATAHRSWSFLKKFEALTHWLRDSAASHVLLLDADAVIVAPLAADDVHAALGDCGLGMVEQTTIRGSGMGRADFLRHYVDHSLAFIAAEAPPPSLSTFRFFNSGVLLGSRWGAKRVTDWALTQIRRAPHEHQVGVHMIADQDYLQVWTNTIEPGSCMPLGWEWNHCEHWDSRYPDANARIAHFSNFCEGPSTHTLARMRAARRHWPPPPARSASLRRLVRFALRRHSERSSQTARPRP